MVVVVVELGLAVVVVVVVVVDVVGGGGVVVVVDVVLVDGLAVVDGSAVCCRGDNDDSWTMFGRFPFDFWRADDAGKLNALSMEASFDGLGPTAGLADAGNVGPLSRTVAADFAAAAVVATLLA